MVLALFLAFALGLAWLAFLVLGIVLLARGCRGRLVDVHPRCRGCGYDLVGAPHRPDRCPECGACLLGVEKVRLGRRRLRPGLVTAGVSVVLLAMLPIAAVYVPGLRASGPGVVPAPAVVAAARKPVVQPPPIVFDLFPETVPTDAASLAALGFPDEPASEPTAGDEPADDEVVEAGAWSPSIAYQPAPEAWERLARSPMDGQLEVAWSSPEQPAGPEAIVSHFGGPALQVDVDFGGARFESWLDPGLGPGYPDPFGATASPLGVATWPLGATPSRAWPGDQPLRVDRLGSGAIRTQYRTTRIRHGSVYGETRRPSAAAARPGGGR